MEGLEKKERFIHVHAIRNTKMIQCFFNLRKMFKYKTVSLGFQNFNNEKDDDDDEESDSEITSSREYLLN